MNKPNRTRRKWWVRLLTVALLAYLGWSAVLYSVQDKLVFPRPSPSSGPLPNRAGFEQTWVTSADGARVEGWYFAAPGGEKKACAVVFHGNGDLIDYQMDYVDFFRARGMSSLLVEYAGYGRSGGTPSEKTVVADSLKFIAWLEARPDVHPAKLVYIGHSLGSAVAAQVAARRAPAALIMEAPFTSIASFAAGFGAPPFLVRSPFRTDHVLPPLAAGGMPILLAASRTDEIVPFSHAARLKQLAPSASLLTVDGSHNDLPLQQESFSQAVDTLLRRAGALPLQQPTK